jgi:hypothetical protein
MASSSQVPHIPTELAKFHQTIKKAGVGAHHQNGVAERNIQTIMAMARTMMLHAAICWPETAEASLWPMAVNYAVHIHNHMPNRTSGLSPIDLFTRTRERAKKWLFVTRGDARSPRSRALMYTN